MFSHQRILIFKLYLLLKEFSVFFELLLLLFLYSFHINIVLLLFLIPHYCLLFHHLFINYLSVLSLFDLLVKRSSQVLFSKLIRVLLVLFFKLKLHISLVNVLLNCFIFSSLSIIHLFNHIFNHSILIFLLSILSSLKLFCSVSFLFIEHFNVSFLNRDILLFFFLFFIFSFSLAFVVFC